MNDYCINKTCSKFHLLNLKCPNTFVSKINELGVDHKQFKNRDLVNILSGNNFS